LQENVQRLEQEYKLEKMRLAESEREALLQEPREGVLQARAAEKGTAGESTVRSDGLPTKNGGLGINEHASEVAREIGTGEEKVQDGRIVPKEGQTQEEIAKERAEKERAEAIKKREAFCAFLLPLSPLSRSGLTLTIP
jgi:hypothetical protein